MGVEFHERSKLIKKLNHMVCFDPEKAVKMIDGYLNMHADDVDILLLKAHLSDSVSAFHKAFDVYSYILAIDPVNVQALIGLGDHYINCRDDCLRALSCYESALYLLSSVLPDDDKQDEFISACIGKADSLIGLGRLDDAVRIIKYGMQKYPDDIVLIAAMQKIRDMQLE